MKAQCDHVPCSGRTVLNARKGLVTREKTARALARSEIWSVGPMKLFDFRKTNVCSILGPAGISHDHA